MLAVYYASNPKFRLRSADGNHFVHLNRPDLVYPHIEEFIKDTS